VCGFTLVGTTVLWWKFYGEYEKRQKLSRTFSQTWNKVNDTPSESFNETSDTFFQGNGTFGETFSKSFSSTDEFQIPLLFVGVNAENMFFTLSILASVFTVRH